MSSRASKTRFPAFSVPSGLPQFVPVQAVILAAELLLAIPVGWLLTRIWQGGIVWIMGGAVSGVLVLYAAQWFYTYTAKPNATARKLGQALVGMAIGFCIVHSNLVAIAPDLPIFTLLTLFLLLSGMAIGYLYSRFSQTNLLTALLATVPGGVSIMSSLAAEYGKNVALVALVQIIRVTMVIVLIPLLARASVESVSIAPPAFDFAHLIHWQIADLSYLAFALGLTTLTTLLLTRWKVPAAPFVAGLIVGVGFNAGLNALTSPLDMLPAIDFTPPPLVSLLGQILLGVTIGEYWGNKPKVSRNAILYALVSVGLTLLAGLLATGLAMQLTGWDWLTCLLITAPGGAPEMILVALSLNHNVELVTAGHLVRLLAINASLPLWVYVFRTLDRRLTPVSSQ
ncbi:MAG TPA: AbrB family transcriptional regulator [Allocoleopsis sp.]